MNSVATRLSLAIGVLWGGALATRGALGDEGEPTVRVERLSQRDATGEFAFSKVPAPSKTDAGNIATVTLVRGTADSNGVSPFVLRDGQLPRNEDQPAANFFLAGNAPGRLLFDFGKPIELRAINTYSWHRSTRADQRYQVHLPSPDVKAADIVKSASAATLPESWR